MRRKLAELNIEYEKIEVNPADKPEIVTRLGGTVPVIDDDGMQMNESDDIVEYLEKKYSSGE